MAEIIWTLSTTLPTFTASAISTHHGCHCGDSGVESTSLNVAETLVPLKVWKGQQVQMRLRVRWVGKWQAPVMCH